MTEDIFASLLVSKSGCEDDLQMISDDRHKLTSEEINKLREEVIPLIKSFDFEELLKYLSKEGMLIYFQSSLHNSHGPTITVSASFKGHEYVYYDVYDVIEGDIITERKHVWQDTADTNLIKESTNLT